MMTGSDASVIICVKGKGWMCTTAIHSTAATVDIVHINYRVVCLVNTVCCAAMRQNDPEVTTYMLPQS